MLLLNISFPHSPSIRPPSWMSSESRDCVTRRGRSYPFYSPTGYLFKGSDAFHNNRYKCHKYFAFQVCKELLKCQKIIFENRITDADLLFHLTVLQNSHNIASGCDTHLL